MRSRIDLEDDLSHKMKSSEDIVKKAETEDRSLSADEKIAFDELQREMDALESAIRDIVETEKRKATIAARAKARSDQPTGVPLSRPAIGDGGLSVDAGARISQHLRCGSLRAFSNDEAGYERAFRSGQWIRAALFNDHVAKSWCRNRGMMLAVNEGTNAAGGALVPEEFTQAIIDLREQYGVFRQNSRVLPMGRDVMIVPRRTGSVSATFTGENLALTESDPTFNQVTLTAKKTGILTRMSTEIAEDAVINMADWLAMDFAWAFAFQEDTLGFVGTAGAGEAGIVGAFTKFTNDNTLAGAVDFESGDDQFTEVTITGLTNVMGALPAFARANAKWYCSALAADTMFMRLAATAGGNTINTLKGDLGLAFLGHPIVITQVAPAVSTALNNQAMVLFGDLGLASTLGDRRGIQVRRSDDRYFELDQIGMKATTRIDIVVHDAGDGTTAGPIVAGIGQS